MPALTWLLQSVVHMTDMVLNHVEALLPGKEFAGGIRYEKGNLIPLLELML